MIWPAWHIFDSLFVLVFYQDWNVSTYVVQSTEFGGKLHLKQLITYVSIWLMVILGSYESLEGHIL